MAKEVREERLVIQFVLTREGGTGSVEVECQANYNLFCPTCSQGWGKAMENIELTGGQVNAVKGIGQAILQKIKALEE